MLSTKNIKSGRPIPKFNAKYICPYRILQIMNSHSYKLELPYELRSIHPVFHTNLLSPAAGVPITGQVNPAPPHVAIDDEGHAIWAVEEIVDSRRRGRGFEYLIRWRGYSEDIARKRIHGNHWLMLLIVLPRYVRSRIGSLISLNLRKTNG